MAKAPAPAAPAPAPAADAKADGAKKKGGGMMSSLIIGGFVMMVIIAETCLFFFAVPSADQVSLLAEENLIKKIEGTTEKKDEVDASVTDNKPVEFPLGDYSIVCQPPGADRMYRIEFKLFATLRNKDKAKIETLFKEIQGRYRHNIILEIRASTFDELNENQLGLIQRRILAKSNELIGEPLLTSVGFENYQVFEE